MDWLSRQLGHPSHCATDKPSDKGGDPDLTQKERSKAKTPSQTMGIECVKCVAGETLDLRETTIDDDALDYKGLDSGNAAQSVYVQ